MDMVFIKKLSTRDLSRKETGKKEREGEKRMASSVIGNLDSQVNKIFFEKGLSKSVNEAERLANMTEEEREAYLLEKKKRDDDIVLY